jgi:hypothetical protein
MKALFGFFAMAFLLSGEHAKILKDSPAKNAPDQDPTEPCP